MSSEKNLESLRTKNSSLLHQLRKSQATTKRHLTSIAKDGQDDKENCTAGKRISPLGKRQRDDDIGMMNVSTKRKTPVSMAFRASPKSSEARKKLNSKSQKPRQSPRLSDPAKKRPRTYTSTPKATPRKQKAGATTPKSALKRRMIVDRHIKVDSKLSEKSLCVTPINNSKTLNFSYSSSPRSGEPSRYTQPEYGPNTTDLAVSESHADLLDDGGNDRRGATVRRDDITHRSRSMLAGTTVNPKRTPGRVTFQESLSRTYSNMIDHQSNEEQRDGPVPLLGYDWIAGLLDNDISQDGKPDQYYEELRQFRKEHQRDCIKKTLTDPVSPTQDTPTSPTVSDPDHTCIHTYNVNSRLFTVPVNKLKDGSSYCPVCRKPRDKPTSTDPGFVRISIPKSTLDDPYKIRPHRRKSYDPSDSCALSEHCLAGWDSSRPKMLPTASNLDVRHEIYGAKAQLVSTEKEVNKMIYETKKTYHVPDNIKQSRIMTYNLRNRRVDLSNPTTSRRMKTDKLLDVSHALRHQLHQLEQQNLNLQNKNPSNESKFPLL